MSEQMRKVSDDSSVVKKLGAYAIEFTFLGTIFGFLINFFIFNQWGIPYSLVASPSDIIVGAAEGIKSLFGLFLCLVLILANLNLLMRAKFPKEIYFWGTYLFSMCLSAMYFIPSIAQKPDDFALIHLPNFLYWSSFYFIACTAIGCGLIFYLKSDEDSELNEAVQPWMPLVIALFFACTFLVTQSAKDRAGKLVLISTSENCQSVEYIVWAGSESIITSCDPPPYNSFKTFYISERPGAVIGTQPAHKNSD